jgi:hypothetical protein
MSSSLADQPLRTLGRRCSDFVITVLVIVLLVIVVLKVTDNRVIVK